MENKMSIMIVDDEEVVRESLFYWFEKSGHAVYTESSGFAALEKLEKVSINIMFADIKMPGMDGLQLLEKVKEGYPDTFVVIITAYGSIESAVKAMQLGASDYLLKPFKPEQLSLVLEKITQQQKLTTEYNYLRGHLEKMSRFDNIIGTSSQMEQIYDLILEVAKTESSVLLTGETGTGKELIAKAIHAKSPRAQCPFIAINCGAMPDTLLESELFGHQKGAFTGATHSRKGFLEVVNGGTLFLDEVGEISPKMQVDLLRVLEEKTINRIGSSETINVDFRLISATRRDLPSAIRENIFREDFYYRINVINIHVPPLRKRREDIKLLIDHFLEKYNQETAKRVSHISQDALQQLEHYEWPGNVREIENAIERAVVLSKSRSLSIKDFPFLDVPRPKRTGNLSLKEMEIEYIKEVLEKYNWNITHAAQALDLNRVTLHKKIKRYDIKKGNHAN